MQIDVTEEKKNPNICDVDFFAQIQETVYSKVLNCKGEQMSFENRVRITNCQVLLC